ncbi:MAG: ATP-binding cassette, subfamily MsbA [Bacteroidetes bacterium]|jgi:subfamily B ATP-binding cassette protein MsbA|nr:ATP-binding cassette, subfamily MsbA [Bacteroidota bacterium]
MLKSVIKKYFKFFAYFYSHLKNRIFFALFLSLTVGLLDGLGLAMFLPLLKMVDEGSSASEGMGNMRFLTDGLGALGIGLNLSSVLCVILFFFVLKGLMKFFESYYRVALLQDFILKLRYESVDKLSTYTYKAFITADSGKIQNTLSGEIGRVVTAYTSYFGTIQNIVFVLVYVVLAFFANPQFALLVAIGGVITNLLYSNIFKRTKKISITLTSIGHNYQGLLIQSVAFFKYLKATARMKIYSSKLKMSINEIQKNNRKIGMIAAFLESSREPLIILVVVSVILVQTTVFHQSLGLIILSLLFFYRSLNYLMLVQTNWNSFLAVSGSLENIDSFIKDLNQNQDVKGKNSQWTFNRSITIENVSFSYGNELVLKNIDLEIKKNETVAFVGESGSGKTTLVNILSGLMPVDSGTVRIDSVDMRDLNISSFQNKIGYITQEPIVFNDSVFNNVTFWAEETQENKIKFWNALKKAAIYDFVMNLPDREKSPLGNNGVMVSGGQKQRISIARELFKEIEVLIMDEATSALDSETELSIQENIDQLKGQCTILIVAHRLSTVKNADKIVLLNKGSVEAVDSFIGMISKSENFKRMIALQEI